MRYCFFADYEIHLAERLCIRAQTTLVHATPDGVALDPAAVLDRVRE
jgi:acyl-CoA thioesterase FadM